MRPGQRTPNEFEVAILERIAGQHPPILVHMRGLHVLSRQFTGVGSYTNFQCPVDNESPRKALPLNGRIIVPGVPNGLGAVLFCQNAYPSCLEIFTYGADNWDGVYEGYAIVEAV